MDVMVDCRVGGRVGDSGEISKASPRLYLQFMALLRTSVSCTLALVSL